MTWLGWVLVGDLALSALFKIAQVGKHREPVSNLDGVCAVVEVAALIVGVFAIGTGHL